MKNYFRIKTWLLYFFTYCLPTSFIPVKSNFFQTMTSLSHLALKLLSIIHWNLKIDILKMGESFWEFLKSKKKSEKHPFFSIKMLYFKSKCKWKIIICKLNLKFKLELTLNCYICILIVCQLALFLSKVLSFRQWLLCHIWP